MAKIKVVHSVDACTIIFKGNPSTPEPSTGIIKFPGGHVEVSRTSNGEYWAHIEADEPSNIVDSRIDYDHEGYTKSNGIIPPIPLFEHIQHIAVKVNGPFIEPGE